MKKLLFIVLIAACVNVNAGKKSATIGYWGIKTVGYGAVLASAATVGPLIVTSAPPALAVAGAVGTTATVSAPISIGGVVSISTKAILAIESAAVVTAAALERCTYLP